MSFNLINDAWIPVRRRSGETSIIKPWELTDAIDRDPIVALNSPRADFNGALIQFLIGLIQTIRTPKDSLSWGQDFKTPPSAKALKEVMEPVAFAFNLDGEKPLFMQDKETLNEKPKSISSLLVETPGEKGLRDNTDFFVKRSGDSEYCMPCAAMSLFTLQTNAPSGGVGHRTSLRGGGPLTTLLMSQESLWRTVWLNVLETKQLGGLGGGLDKEGWSFIFPWLSETRTSETNGGKITTPIDVHPFQAYWGMPRRIELDFFNVFSGECSICGNESEKLIRQYRTKNYGTNYEGPWIHPLTPISYRDTNVPIPKKGSPGGMSYRHWLGCVFEGKDGNQKPSVTVSVFCNSLARRRISQLKLSSFGYDMDNMKARCWYESQMPLILAENDEGAEIFEEVVVDLIRGAEHVANSLRICVRKALFASPQNAKGDFSFIDNRFWKSTEPEFFKSLETLRQEPNNEKNRMEIKLSWAKTLFDHGEKIFDSLCQSSPIGTSDLKRSALAWNEFKRNALLNHSKKLKNALSLED